MKHRIMIGAMILLAALILAGCPPTPSGGSIDQSELPCRYWESDRYDDCAISQRYDWDIHSFDVKIFDVKIKWISPRPQLVTHEA